MGMPIYLNFRICGNGNHAIIFVLNIHKYILKNRVTQMTNLYCEGDGKEIDVERDTNLGWEQIYKPSKLSKSLLIEAKSKSC